MKTPVSTTRGMKVRNRGRLSRALAAALCVVVAACSAEDPEKLLASAKQYVEKDDYKAAAIQLKNVLQLNPKSLEARFLLGKAFLVQGNGQSAELELRKALDGSYPSETVVPELARAMLLQGKSRDILTEFGRTKLDAPAAVASLKTTIAAAHASIGEMALAQAAVDAALAVVPDDAEAALMQARLLAARGESDAALKTTEGILARDAKNYNGLKFKGDLLLYAKNQPDAAFDAYSKAVQSHPDYSAAYTGLMTILLAREKLDEAEQSLGQLRKIAPNNLETRFFEAQLAYQKKDYKKAKDAIQQVLKAAPDDPRFLQLAGAIEFQTESLIQAEFFLAKALKIQPRLQFARRLLVATYLRQGQPARAIAALPADIQKDSNDADMLALAGQAYLQSGDPKRSEALLARASQLDPSSTGKRTTLAVARVQGAEPERGIKQLREIANSDEGVNADLELIRTHLRRLEFDPALAAIEKLEKKQPGSAMPAYLRGLVYLGLKDIALARRNFEKALEIDPKLFPAAANLATLDMSGNKPDAAQARFQTVLKQDPKNLQALLALADLKSRTGGKVEEVASLLQEAVTAHPDDAAPRRVLVDYYLTTRNPKLALAAAQTALAAIPGDPRLLDALGRAQQASGESNQALATFGQLAGSQPDSPQAQMRLAGSYLIDNKPELAEQAWKQALKIKPDYLDAQRALIIHYVNAKKFEEALNIARKVREQRPKELIGWLLEGDVAMARKDWAEAIVVFRSGLKKEPSSIMAVRLHWALQSDGKTAEAADWAKNWLGQHPTDIYFEGYLGNSALAKKDFPVAEKSYRAVLKARPEDLVALNNLAWIAVEQSRPEALALAEKANQLAPNRAPVMDTLAMALAQKGEHAKALDLQKKAVALQPQNALLKLNLAKIYLKAGDRANARLELDALAAMGDKFPKQQEVAELKGTL